MNTFIFDLDGVIYRDHEAVPGAAPAIAALRAAGHRILFATNNATRRRDEFQRRIEAVGVPARMEEIATSAYATARYLSTLAQPPATALVVGSPALASELSDAGIRVLAYPADDTAEPSAAERPDVVVVGLDREFSYRKLAWAQAAVLAGASLVATNRDPQFPGAHGRIWPGSGSIVASLEAACRMQAVAIGKPGPLLYKMLLQSTGADAARTIVVGDNLETDIAAAAAMKMASVLVLTGISGRADLLHAVAKPTIVIENLAELAAMDTDTLLALQRGV
jgi:phosphoglycolate/pyridoxal phosphate phosphatase family enzyme